MWGGKFNLGKFKIYGAWHPKRGKIKVGLKREEPYDFLDYKDLQEQRIDLNLDEIEDNFYYPTG